MPDKYVVARCPHCGNENAKTIKSMGTIYMDGAIPRGADYLCTKCGTYFDANTFTGTCIEKFIPGFSPNRLVPPVRPPPDLK